MTGRTLQHTTPRPLPPTCARRSRADLAPARCGRWARWLGGAGAPQAAIVGTCANGARGPARLFGAGQRRNTGGERALWREELIQHQFEGGDQRLAAIARLRAIFYTRTGAEWEELCRGKDVSVTPILTPAEALGWMGEASMPRLSQTPAAPGLRPPTAGEHTTELFGSSF